MPWVERVRWAVNVVSDFIFTNPLAASKVCEALASLKGCFFMFFVSEFPVFIH